MAVPTVVAERVSATLQGAEMLTFLELANMVDATQVMGLGWGGMITFLALPHMVDAMRLMGLGWGGAMLTFLIFVACEKRHVETQQWCETVG